MSVISGNYGQVLVNSSELIEVTNWKFSKKANLHAWCSSSCNGYSRITAGTKSGSGSLSGLYDVDDPIDSHLDIGDDATALLYYSDSAYFSVPLTVESIDIEVDINDGAPVSFELAFQTDGEWS